MALRNNDTQGAMMYLDIALSVLGGGGGTQGNMTTATIAAEGDEGEGNARPNEPNEFDNCTVVGNGRDVGDVGCLIAAQVQSLSPTGM